MHPRSVLACAAPRPVAGRGAGKGGGKGGRGGGKGGGKGFGYSEGPPDSVVEMGVFEHACEGDLVVKSTNEKVHLEKGRAALGHALC